MKSKRPMNAVWAAVMALTMVSAWAEDPAQEAAIVSFDVTPKLFVFDYFKGFDSDRIQFLERYNYQRGFDGDRRSDFYLDADLRLTISNAERELFRLERQGFGSYNHRGSLEGNTAKLGVDAYYSFFRSATGGLGYRYGPNQVTGGTDPSYFFPAGTNANSGYVAQFNDDSSQSLFKIDRTTFGVGFALKPQLFGAAAASGPSVVLNYDGYSRDGNRFATYVLGGSDVTGAAARVLQRWRGFDMPVDESMNRYTLNLTGAPGGVQISYQGVLEKFDNDATNYTVADFAPLSPFLVASNKPIHFIPDSTLMSNNLRLARNFGSTAIGAGYGLSVLDQDSFTERQQTFGYSDGEITTTSAYFNVNSSALKVVGLEAFYKYYSRDNDSTFPVAGLISDTQDQTLGVRIDEIKSESYGLAASLRIAALKSNITAGWKREDKQRDLTWTAVSTVAPLLNGIQPQRSLYGEESLLDEYYVNLVMRPTRGLIFRLSTSYVDADETALVTEPENALHFKTKLSYVADSGMLTSAYYNYKKLNHDDSSLTSALLPAGTDGAATAQDVSRTQQAAGLTFSMPVGERITTTANFSWMQDDLKAYFLRSDRRRFEAPNNAITFLIQDRPNYLIDTYVLMLGGDMQVSDTLRWSGSYTYSESTGDTASGTTLAALPSINGRIDNSVNTIALEVEYALREALRLKGSYAYDYYKDKVYSDLTGGYHTFMLSVSFGF